MRNMSAAHLRILNQELEHMYDIEDAERIEFLTNLRIQHEARRNIRLNATRM